jgi:hypothetical protein
MYRNAINKVVEINKKAQIRFFFKIVFSLKKSTISGLVFSGFLENFSPMSL